MEGTDESQLCVLHSGNDGKRLPLHVGYCMCCMLGTSYLHNGLYLSEDMKSGLLGHMVEGPQSPTSTGIH